MNRRGIMLLELFVAGAIVAMLLTFTLQLIGAAVAQRRAADLRQCALLELGNLMERLAAKPWDELTAEKLSQEKLSETAVGLPNAELKIEVFETSDAPVGKRIAASLRWQDDSNQCAAPVRLTIWRFHASPRPLGEKQEVRASSSPRPLGEIQEVRTVSFPRLLEKWQAVRASSSPRPLGEGLGVRAIACSLSPPTLSTPDPLAKILVAEEVKR